MATKGHPKFFLLDHRWCGSYYLLDRLKGKKVGSLEP